MDLLFFAIAGAIVTADQLTKWAVRSNLALGESWPHNGGMIKIVHVVNSGAAFGILQGQTPFLIVTSLLGLGAILLYYVYPPMDHGLVRLALLVTSIAREQGGARSFACEQRTASEQEH